MKDLNIPKTLLKCTKNGNSYLISYKIGKRVAQEKYFKNYKKEEITEITNSPISGFKIQKYDEGFDLDYYIQKLGEVHIIDPRGWTMKTKVKNIINLLSTHNYDYENGFSGEFVYAWEGKDWQLLPVEADEYKATLGNDVIVKHPDDCIVGGIYKIADSAPMAYLGKHPIIRHTYETNYKSNNQTVKCTKSNSYIFVQIENFNSYKYNAKIFQTTSKPIYNTDIPHFSEDQVKKELEKFYKTEYNIIYNENIKDKVDHYVKIYNNIIISWYTNMSSYRHGYCKEI